MCRSLLLLACVLLLSSSSLGCSDCFLVDLSLTLTRLCSGLVLDQTEAMSWCFQQVKEAFDGNEKVIEAARVGAVVWLILSVPERASWI